MTEEKEQLGQEIKDTNGQAGQEDQEDQDRTQNEEERIAQLSDPDDRIAQLAKEIEELKESMIKTEETLKTLGDRIDQNALQKAFENAQREEEQLNARIEELAEQIKFHERVRAGLDNVGRVLSGMPEVKKLAGIISILEQNKSIPQEAETISDVDRKARRKLAMEALRIFNPKSSVDQIGQEMAETVETVEKTAAERYVSYRERGAELLKRLVPEGVTADVIKKAQEKFAEQS